MIKNKSKQELIEMVYEQNVELQHLRQCTSIQHEVITDISDSYKETMEGKWFDRLIKIIKLPFTLKNKMNNNEVYFYTYKLNKFTTMKESEILKSLDYINRYEDKAISPTEYMKHIEHVIGISVCKSCGSSNDRLHNDFQRRIFNLVKTNFRHLAFETQFVSGKYRGKHYTENVPFYTYHNLIKLERQMKKEIKNYKLRGIIDQIDKLNEDLLTLQDLIEKRKKSYIKEVDEVTELKEEIEELKEDIQEIKEEIDIPTEKVEAPEIAKVDEVDDKLVEAVKLYNEGVHPKKIASTLELEYKGLTGKIKAYIKDNPVK